MEQSILKSVKQILDIEASETHFDFDLLTLINSAFSTLNQIGLGPQFGLTVEDDTTLWAAFIGTDPRLNSVKTYVCLSVRSIFDPPQSSFAVAAVKDQIAELAWRLNVYREETQWVNPNGSTDIDNGVIDGGSP